MIELLELACRALGPLREEVVLLGGAAIPLWITDPAARPARLSKDVDVIIEVATYGAYQRFAERLREQKFTEDAKSKVICRFFYGEETTELVLDVMPTDESVLGFGGGWAQQAFSAAEWVTLPSGQKMRAATPPYLLATKIEAFRGRGKGDFLASHDFEDVVVLVDGRDELLRELEQAEPEVKRFVAEAIGQMRRDPLFRGGLEGAIGPFDRERVPIVDERLASIAELVA
jgi:predicted nucleotidyltransferase